MNTIKALMNINRLDCMTILACVYHCATMPKAERERFKYEHGVSVDIHLTDLIERIDNK